ncbi:MAG: helix-turn-helix transcriptional regulator [Alphaproteobacteria bacterium]|nr:helix-turn-helix transcriptional regulator [Alphaproteobacteria bacterium]
MTVRPGLTGCGVAETLKVIGDRWSLLILRNAFHGVRRFDAFQEQLSISTSVLSDRLARLVREGVLERRPAPDDGRAAEYRLTEAGLDLYPVLISLNQWGDRWRPDPAGERLRLIERATGQPIRGAAVLSEAGAPLTARDVAPEAGPALAPDLAELVETHRKRLLKSAP